MPKTLDDLNEWAVALRKEEHPLADTMEEIADGWQAERDLLAGILESILETCDSGRDSERSLEGIKMDAEYGLRMIKGERRDE